MPSRCLRLISFVASVAAAAACSQQPSALLSPTGPSAVLQDTSAGVSGGGWSTVSAGVSTGRGSNPGRGRKGVSGVGTVANLRGTCDPSGTEDRVSFNVQGVKVVTDEDTEFFIDAEEAIAEGCGNLRNGSKVRVVAAETQNADGSFTAQTVTIIDQPGGAPPTPVAGDGVVGALKGSCPSLTMVVHGYPVMTTSSTVFEGGECAAIAPGTRVHVEGVLGGNSVVADTVKILGAQ